MTGRPRSATAGWMESGDGPDAIVPEQAVDRRVLEYRAAEPGRGRQADSPRGIPLAGWRDILLRTMSQIAEDRAGLAAAGVTFLGLLAIFPAIAVFVSAYSLIADIGTARNHVELLAGYVPGAVLDLIAAELQRLANTKETGAGIGVIIGLLITLWTANNGVKALFVAMNVAYNETEKRGFVQLTLVSLLFTLGTILLAILAVNALIFVPILLNALPLGPVAKWVTAILPLVLLLLIANLAIAVLYRFGPSRTNAKWRWITAGSVTTSIAWVAASLAFTFYLANFGNYNATYGTLGAVIGFMMWMYISAYVLLAGAELNAEIEHQTARDTTVGPEKPMGERGAYVADTLGEKP